MLFNYFKIAWRSLWKHKGYSLINIAGLSIGLTACLVVATVVVDELSYDHQWKKADDIYRVLSVSTGIKGEEPQPMSVSGFGASIKKDLPEVLGYSTLSVSKSRLLLGPSGQGVAFQQLSARPGMWGLLDFNVLAGNPKKFERGYTNLVITKKIRDQYFKGQDPVGKIVTSEPEYGAPQRYLITGVIESIPQNSHLRADLIAIEADRASENNLPFKDGAYSLYPQYVLLRHGTSLKSFTVKANQWYAKATGSKKPDYVFSFQPMKDVYLRSNFNAVQNIHGNIRDVYIFAGVAMLLLFIACINFINLTISRVFNRSKETGIRKVLGAGTPQLMMRFLSESLIFFIVSFLIALSLYPVLISYVESYLGHPLVLTLFSSSFLGTVICLVLAVSMLTGLYPAWFLSRPQPVAILKNKIAAGVHLSLLKKGLVTGQFVISAAIIMVAIIVHSQLNFISKKDLGFDKNNLLNLSYMAWGKPGAAFKQSVKQLPGVINASITGWYPSGGTGNMSTPVAIPGQKEKVDVFTIWGDIDLAQTLKFKLKAGHMFNPSMSASVMNIDSIMGGSSPATRARIKDQPLLITNYTASLLSLNLNGTAKGIYGSPVGIIENFNSESLHNQLKPIVIQPVKDFYDGNMLIRIKPGTNKQVLASVNKLFKAFYPDKQFIYNWVDEQVNEQYKAEYKLQQLFTCFSLLIIFLACLGLFGLVTFTAEQRVKEIGIRKVLGAGVDSIVMLISKDYLWLVLIAVAIASPIAWYAMSKWLQDFAYRIHIQWWVFALTGCLAFIIAFATISFQSVKAALANPVKSLRSE